MKNLLYIFIICLICCNIWQYWNPKVETIVRNDTITLFDTITIKDTIPKLKYKYITKIEKDTLYLTKDSTKEEVQIPIETRIYEGGNDSIQYEAQISGFKPQLDNISFKMIYPTQTITKFVKTKENKFKFGLSGGIGYGLTTNNFDAWLGIGGTFKF